MDTQELYRRGIAVRKEIFGAEAVEKRMSALGEFGAPLQDLINGYGYGDVWSRPGLDRKTRSLITLAALTAMVRPNQVRVHVRGALANGATPEEIREVLLHTTVYAGVPAGVEAFNAAAEVLKELGAK